MVFFGGLPRGLKPQSLGGGIDAAKSRVLAFLRTRRRQTRAFGILTESLRYKEMPQFQYCMLCDDERVSSSSVDVYVWRLQMVAKQLAARDLQNLVQEMHGCTEFINRMSRCRCICPQPLPSPFPSHAEAGGAPCTRQGESERSEMRQGEGETEMLRHAL